MKYFTTYIILIYIRINGILIRHTLIYVKKYSLTSVIIYSSSILLTRVHPSDQYVVTLSLMGGCFQAYHSVVLGKTYFQH